MHRTDPQNIAIIGAGIAGLAAALRLGALGHEVHVYERATQIGGKMRSLPSKAGPIDAGPTVLTMREVFDDLFAAAGSVLDAHVTLVEQKCIARHFWPDGTQLDLFRDHATNMQAIKNFAGAQEAHAFERFCCKTRDLFAAFEKPMMKSAAPNMFAIGRASLAVPRAWPWLMPHKVLADVLKDSFSCPKLQQLFGRYATYVGGSPYQSPALLSLIWQAEASGVWAVKGGMQQLAKAIFELSKTFNVTYHLGSHIRRIICENGHARAIENADGNKIHHDIIIFNGDPKALGEGMLGADVLQAAPQPMRTERSLSAQVWAFAARVTGPELQHHNIFFNDAPKAEFDAIANGRLSQGAPTLYLCAQDRGFDTRPKGLERFEIIINAPALAGLRQPAEDYHQCLTRSFQHLERFGLSFGPKPQPSALTTPAGFQRLFPGSNGALYGQSPHGMTASLQRPRARSRIRGLYLCGGGTHPGAGVPMATLSAAHVVEMIMKDQISISKSRQTGMRGGMSTA